MQQFEHDYAGIIEQVLRRGEVRETRNGETKSTFGEHLKVYVGDMYFPLLQGRMMYPKGILGEFAALIRQPKTLADFEKWGCNYWKLWAKEDGTIDVDYGNAWFNFNGVNQIAQLKDKLANNPTDRRMVVSGWKPDGIDDLDLPCCHMMYQFYVNKRGHLDMMWTQRSVDLMIGLPADIVLAATWLITLAREFGLTPGTITFSLGDCHIYKEHYEAAVEYIERVATPFPGNKPCYMYTKPTGAAFEDFEPADMVLSTFASRPKLNLELKA